MTDYPRMMYRTGGDLADHKLGDVPLKIQGKFECETLIVDDAQAEADALADGWTIAPDPDVQTTAQIVAATLAEKDAEIELLKARLAQAGAFDHDGDGKPGGSLPRRGRPPKQQEPALIEETADGFEG